MAFSKLSGLFLEFQKPAKAVIGSDRVNRGLGDSILKEFMKFLAYIFVLSTDDGNNFENWTLFEFAPPNVESDEVISRRLVFE